MRAPIRITEHDGTVTEGDCLYIASAMDITGDDLFIIDVGGRGLGDLARVFVGALDTVEWL